MGQAFQGRFGTDLNVKQSKMSSPESTGIIAVADPDVRDCIRRHALKIPELRIVAEARDGKQALALLLGT